MHAEKKGFSLFTDDKAHMESARFDSYPVCDHIRSGAAWLFVHDSNVNQVF